MNKIFALVVMLLAVAPARANRAVMEQLAASNNAIFIDTPTASVEIGTVTAVPGISLNVEGAAEFGQGATKSTFTKTGNLLVPGSVTATGGFAGTSSSATNLAGGAAGSVPYQTGAGITAFVSAAANKVLSILGTTPTWLSFLPTTVSISTANVSPGFNAASNFVQLNSSGQFPGLDGSLIQNISGVLSGGTTGALPYWSASNALGNSQIIRDSATSLTVVGATVTFKNGGGAPVSSRQFLLSGTGTYTTPANVRQLRIRMVGGGGGAGAGNNNGTAGTAGSSTTWITAGSTIAATGGTGGTQGGNAAGAGGMTAAGTGGSGVYASSTVFRSQGGSGQPSVATSVNAVWGCGASSLLGAGAVCTNGTSTAVGASAAANTGGGGSGGASANFYGGGGGAGEYVELTVNAPLATYTYTVGGGGAAGTIGGNAYNGGTGGSGVIVVEETY